MFARQDGQRVSERREAYRATFSAGDDEYLTELDWATWRRLRTGMRYRLKISTLSGEVKQVAPLRGSWSLVLRAARRPAPPGRAWPAASRA